MPRKLAIAALRARTAVLPVDFMLDICGLPFGLDSRRPFPELSNARWAHCRKTGLEETASPVYGDWFYLSVVTRLTARRDARLSTRIGTTTSILQRVVRDKTPNCGATGGDGGILGNQLRDPR